MLHNAIDASEYTLEDQRRMSYAKNYFAWQTRLVRPYLGRRIVEVGSGIGNFTGNILDRDVVAALELEPDCLAELCKRYPGRPNLHIIPFDIESDSFLPLKSFQPDTCVCLNVLEHIQRDRQAVAGMASILPPGGRVILIVPAFEALYGPIDRGLRHHRRYRKSHIQDLAQTTSLEVEVLRYMNVVGFFGWWANAHIFRRKLQSVAQIKIFDRFFAPVMPHVEALSSPPFGQSLFAVLRKLGR